MGKERSEEELKITIRGVDPKAWQEAKVECARSKTLTLGDIVNEGLQLRQAQKNKPTKK